MARPKKPTIKTRCGADRYALPGERIAEIHDGERGCLLSVRRTANGLLVVEVYRADPDVIVRGPYLASVKG